MKRSGPPKRRTPLKANPDKTREWQRRSQPLHSRRATLARSGGLAPRSAKMDKFMRTERVPLVVAMEAESDRCEVGPFIDRAIRDADRAAGRPETGWRSCTGKMQGLHERRKNGQGGSLTDRANLMRSCNVCNGQVEDAVGAVRDSLRAAGVIVTRLDPEWEALAR